MITNAKPGQEARPGRLLIVDTSQAQVERVIHLRCPRCQKLLAKCAARGVIEIVCPRCKSLVRTTFA